jgi:2-oxoglutarate-Fe(II)-dependent oxygenase superfamily protein/uncharacterized protein DUF6817
MRRETRVVSVESHSPAFLGPFAAAEPGAAPAKTATATATDHSRLGDEFGRAQRHEEPYRFVTARCTNLPRLRELRERLEAREQWSHCEQSFFGHWETSLSHEGAEGVEWLVSEECLQSVRRTAERWFDRPLATKVEVLAHKMQQGHYSDLHNDSPRFGCETHRLNVYLNEDWTAAQGGRLRIASSGEVEDVKHHLEPTFGSVMAFEASAGSFHGVEPVLGGTRYSLMFYMWHAANTPEIRHSLRTMITDARSAHERQIRSRFSSLVESLEASGAEDIPHGSSNLLDHLIETASLLRAWQEPEHVWLSGLLQGIDDELLLDDAEPIAPAEIAPELRRKSAALLAQLAAAGGLPASNDAPAELSALQLANLVATVPHLPFTHERWLARKLAFEGVRLAGAGAREAAGILFANPQRPDHPYKEFT